MTRDVRAPAQRHDVRMPRKILEEAHVREARRREAIQEHITEYERRNGEIPDAEVAEMRRRLGR